MKTVTAAEFRTHCCEWIEHVRSKREHVLITKRGLRIAKLVPLTKEELKVLSSFPEPVVGKKSSK